MLSLENTKIAIIGMGYVGLPLAVEFAKIFPVIGFDINIPRIKELKTGIDSTLEINKEELSEAKYLSYSSDIEDLKQANVYIVTVPTPIDKHKKPDLTPLEKASKMLGADKSEVLLYRNSGDVTGDKSEVVGYMSAVIYKELKVQN